LGIAMAAMVGQQLREVTGKLWATRVMARPLGQDFDGPIGLARFRQYPRKLDANSEVSRALPQTAREIVLPYDPVVLDFHRPVPIPFAGRLCVWTR
jgi:hypothetical protein